MKKKILQKAVAGLMAAALAVTAAAGSTAEVQAKTKKCTSGIMVSGKFYPSDYCSGNRTINLTMCAGTTSKSVAQCDIMDKYDEVKTRKGKRPFEIRMNKSIYLSGSTCYEGEKHRVSWSSSRPSAASVSSDGTVKAVREGISTITAKTACGNVYKIKITVVSHQMEADSHDKYTSYCKICGKKEKAPKGIDVTEEEIHRRIIETVGEDRVIYGEEIPEYNKSWVCEDWQRWLSGKIWGFNYDDKDGIYNRRELKRSEYKNVRSGDVVLMKMDGEPHVCMVVENLHDGTFTVTAWAGAELWLGMSEEDELEWWGSSNSYDNPSYNSRAITKIYTFYKK